MKLFSAEEITQLLKHVYNSQEKDVKRLLDKDPDLLLQTGSFNYEDHTGRTQTITGKAFQIAMRNGDAAMCQMIKPYFNKLPNGDKVMIEQFREEENRITNKINKLNL
jgi:hypothetical protein